MIPGRGEAFFMYHSDLDEVGEPLSPPHAPPNIKVASAQLMWNGHHWYRIVLAQPGVSGSTRKRLLF